MVADSASPRLLYTYLLPSVQETRSVIVSRGIGGRCETLKRTPVLAPSAYLVVTKESFAPVPDQ
jgi:hypothetical protein